MVGVLQSESSVLLVQFFSVLVARGVFCPFLEPLLTFIISKVLLGNIARAPLKGKLAGQREGSQRQRGE